MPTREQTDCLSLPLLPKKHTQAHSLWCLMAAGLWALPRGQGQAGLGRDVRQERRATFPPALQGDGHSGPSSHEWPETLVSICFQVSVLKEDAGEWAGELPPEEQWGAGAEVPARPGQALGTGQHLGRVAETAQHSRYRDGTHALQG